LKKKSILLVINKISSVGSLWRLTWYIKG